MIAVCIATYNHEAFIAQAVESVLAQVCDEPLRIYIGDDASTDGTAAICERYAQQDACIVYIRRKKNLGLTSNTLDLYRRILADGCEYIAMLDGDDYWMDPHKLQLQLYYLRSHPEVGFVHTNGQTLSGKDTWTFGQRQGLYGINSVGFANCTVLFRTNLLNEPLLKDIEQQHFLWLDYPLYGVFYQQTKWAFLPQKTAVWRDHVSVSQPRSAHDILRLRQERCRMWKWLDNLFPGKVGYTAQEAQNYVWSQQLNLIYQFNDRSLVTPDLLNDYKPCTWKQRIKQKGLKNSLYYTILRKIM
jgi:glycosyltransferase involved in cell wall biosynthesis